MRLFLTLAAALAVLLAPPPALAAAKDAVLNKEGFWGIDVDGDACAASMTLQGGTIFLLRAQEGRVTFGLFSRKPIAWGKAGRIETEAYGFDFAPSYGEEASTLFYNGDFDARALAALRLARQARILIDGRPVAAMTLEGTGFEGALDGVIACSRGQAGWWGAGYRPGAPPDAAAGAGAGLTGEAADRPAMNKQGYWALEAGDGYYCVATARVGEDRVLQIVANGDDVGFAVGGEGKLPRGRAGKAETDAYAFAFTPRFDGDDLMTTVRPIDSQALDALRRAKRLRLTVDGRELMDADLEDTGFPELLDSALACSAGKPGWWGEGAKAR